MNKTKKKNRKKVDTVKSVNNSIRTSVRKLNPILKGIVGKKVDVAIRDLQFSEKRIIPFLKENNINIGKDLLYGVAPRRDWFVEGTKSLSDLDRVFGSTDEKSSQIVKVL